MTDEMNKHLAAIEARLMTIEKWVGINVTADDLPKRQHRDLTARMSMPRSVAEEMAKATAGVDADVIADGRRRNPMKGK